jgi:hypothetical protein
LLFGDAWAQLERKSGKADEREMSGKLQLRGNANRKMVAGRQEKHPGPGGKKLRLEADKQVGEVGEQLVKALAEVACKGNVSSARLLVGLANEAEFVEYADPLATARVINLPAEWASEPEWPLELPAETEASFPPVSPMLEAIVERDV